MRPRRCPPNTPKRTLRPSRLFQNRLHRCRRLSRPRRGQSITGFRYRHKKATEIAAASVVTPPDVEPAQGSQLLRDQSGRQASSRATALNDCRDILHNERPLMRYSIRDAAQNADHEALSVAEACARTSTRLTQLGTECAGLFNSFEVFQSKLTKHVNRVCREAAEKDTTP